MSIEAACKGLEQLIDSTNDLYDVILERFPHLEKSIELSSEETRILLDYFIRTRPGVNEQDAAGMAAGNFRITEILENIRCNIEMVDRSLLYRDEINSLLHAFMETGTTKGASIDDLLNIVAVIDGALSDIDLISLNAIIFAGTLGQGGAPFSVVAENIKKLSSNISESNTAIQSLIGSLQQWLNDFRNNIRDLLEFRDRITARHAARVKELFNKAIESLGEIGAQLYDLLNNVNRVIEPGRELMVLIQNQDIIRQEMENLSALLSSLDKHNYPENRAPAPEEKEKILDLVAFLAKTARLADKLMEHITEQLDESAAEINGILDKLETELADIHEDSRYLRDFFSNPGGRDKRDFNGAVDETFHHVSTFIGDFMQVVKELNEHSIKLTSDRLVFVNSLEETDTYITAVGKQLEGMKRLRLLSSIELARLGKENHSFNRDMERITTQVMNAISENKKQYLELKNILKTNLEKLDQTMTESQANVEKAGEIIERSREELSITQEIVNQAIQALHMEITHLKDAISSIKQDFSPSREFVLKAGIIAGDIKYMVEHSEKELQYFLDYYDETEWETRNRELNDIIGRFTVHAQKVKAREVFEDLELSEGHSGEGELTLF